MLRRRSNVSCFFCNSAISLPKDPTNFRCPYCNCLNRWVDGNIVSDEPAMHDENLNSRAFSKRGGPSKDRLPTMYGPGVFCHTCQTNQLLLINLLANYLPPPGSPESDQRMQTLDEYRESLHLRYPPVCDSCRPAVEEEIRRKDAMARTQALGGWLNQTKGKARQRQASLTHQETDKLGMEMLAWRIRGCLWAATVATSMFGSASAVWGYRPFSSMAFMLPVLPALALVSIFWVAWDPTYSSFRSARIQGRDVRIRGKTKHIILQMLSWTFRLITSIILAAHWFRKADYLHLSQFPSTRSRLYFSVSFLIELCAAFLSFFILRLQQPPAIRLIDTTTHKLDPSRARSQTPIAVTHPPAQEPDLLAALSFSSRPVIASQAPVFGLPSMLSSLTFPVDSKPDADEMDVDWTPADSKGKASASAQSSDALWLRPQRFFAPEAPTGLEGLFERTKLVDDVTMADATSRPASRPSGKAWNWWWVYASSLIPLAGLAYKAWGSSRRTPDDYFVAPETASTSLGSFDMDG